MTGKQLQACLIEAERLLCDEKWQVDEQEGLIWRNGHSKTIPTEAWFMMRAILIGVGYSHEIRPRD